MNFIVKGTLAVTGRFAHQSIEIKACLLKES